MRDLSEKQLAAIRLKDAATSGGTKIKEEQMAYTGFDKLKAKIAAKGKVEDPGAVAAEIGMKKYGKDKMENAAKEGKKMAGMKPKKKINSIADLRAHAKSMAQEETAEGE